MGEPKGRRRYDREFKEDAIRLILDGGRTVRGVARDLGIHGNMSHRWKQEYLQDKEHSFPGKGRMKPHEEDVFKLKRKIADLEEDRAILRKSVGHFLETPHKKYCFMKR
jgi:transposase